MILEGLVTTLNPDGTPHLAPMGPRVEPGLEHFLLRPFPTSQTFRNLEALGDGVLHVSDDVLLLVHAALGAVDPLPPLFPAAKVRGFVLQDTCHYFEFRVRSLDEHEERVRIECEVVHRATLRDFFGFNRAKHAVVEAAILATRTDFLSLEGIEAEYCKFAVIIDKTGGAQEQAAFAFLRDHLAEVRQARAS